MTRWQRAEGRGQPRWHPYCGFAIVTVVVLTGCAVVTRTRRAAFPFEGPAVAGSPIEDGYDDHPGVIHIHTTYSHDAQGRFEDVARVANLQQLDYVIVTEHNTLQPLRDGLQGRHGRVLVLIGVEISTQSGHYLSLNVTQDIDRHTHTTQQIIDEVNRQGGFGFIAHPYFKHGRWRNWAVTGFTGLEAYNAAHDTLDENKLRLAVWTLTTSAEPFYLSILDRPYDPLAKWDELIRERGRVVGIGSADAHEFHVAGFKFAPYEVMFQIVRTHVLTPPGALTAEAVYDALRQGHAYIGIELIAEAEGFTFVAERGQRVVGIMGDEVPLAPGLRLATTLPAAAELALFKDGQPIATTIGPSWDMPVTEPGAYRLEASRHGKPWIMSNPIYVRPAPMPADSGRQTADGTISSPNPTSSP